MSEEKDTAPDFGDDVDQSTFEQILEMDDVDDDGKLDREFSRSIVFGFFDQAEATFKKMHDSLKGKSPSDLDELSEQGHFLKGSSATLGFTHIKDECEKIQNLGHMRNETGAEEYSNDREDYRKRIAKCLETAENSYIVVKQKLTAWYATEP